MSDAGSTEVWQEPSGQPDLGHAPPSFCVGAAVATPDGPRDIAALAIGDIVSTSGDDAARVLWIGVRRIDPALLPAAAAGKFLPVCIAAGALGAGSPVRALHLAPSALIWFDSGMVSAETLINGITITQPQRREPFEYRQVALSGAGTLVAENVAVAAFNDAGWGNGFADPSGIADLPVIAAAPLLAASAIVQLRQRLAIRAAQLMVRTTTDPALRLVLDGKIVLPSRRDADTYHFTVQGGASDVRLVSRSVVPAEMPDAGADQRRLGVYVLAVTVRGPHMRVDIDPAMGLLRDGFHPFGAGQRHCWTNGYAALPSGPFGLVGDVAEVEIRITASSLTYRADPVPDGPVVLVLDASLPTPDRDAGSNVIFEQIKLLQELGYGVVFVPLHNFARRSPYAEALEALGVEVIHRPWYDDLASFMALRGESFAFAYIHRLWVAEQAVPVLRRARPDMKILFNTADLHHLRSQRAAALTGNANDAALAEAERLRELAVISAVDATIVCNSVERDLLHDALPEARVAYLPWVRSPVAGVVPDFAQRSGIMFLGGFNHPPNADGLIWFVREVMPKLRSQVPGISLTIYGADMPQEVFALAAPDIIIAGYIETLKPAFDRHRLSVAPLRYGAGFKGKVAESLAHGVPVVASPIAAEGTGLVDGMNVLVAEDAETMAAAIAGVYGNRDLWLSLSRAGQVFVADKLSPAEGKRVIRNLLVALGVM